MAADEQADRQEPREHDGDDDGNRPDAAFPDAEGDDPGETAAGTRQRDGEPEGEPEGEPDGGSDGESEVEPDVEPDVEADPVRDEADGRGGDEAAAARHPEDGTEGAGESGRPARDGRGDHPDDDRYDGEEPGEGTGGEEAGGEAAPAHRPARSGAAAGAGAARAERAAAPPEDLSADSFGSWLRRQREMREIDLREIAEQTKISLRYLKAMEQDRFDVLPAEVFARGFLREYARYVGLNPDEVVNYYLSSHEGATEGEEPLEPASMSAESRGPVSWRLVAALIALLVLAGATYWWFYQQSRDGGEARQEAPPMAAPVDAAEGEPESPEPPPEPAPEPAPEVPLVVTLDFTQNCWVEARADDDRRVSRLFAAGESLQLEAEERVVLENLGNVDGVNVQVNGEPYELPPAQGNSVRDVVIEAPEPPAPRRGARTGGTRTGGAQDGGAQDGGPQDGGPGTGAAP